MDCVYGYEDCSCGKCQHCGLCTNGSQVHRNCLEYYLNDEEVSELMAGPAESLPTSEEEELADALQSDVPLSAEAHEIEAGEAHAEEYKRITFDVSVFQKNLVDCIPEVGVVGGKITINRYLSRSCSILMYRLMKTQWTNLIRVPEVNMISLLYYDLKERCSYHDECIPEEIKATCTVGCMKITRFESNDLCDYIADNLDVFFCQGCDRSMIENYSNWDKELCRKAGIALGQKKMITCVFDHKGESLFELQVKNDGLLTNVPLVRSEIKKQRTDE